MKLIREFKTTQCDISIFDTEYKVEWLEIYCIKSLHRKSGKATIRFGTQAQIEGIIKTYHLEKRFKL